MVKLGFALICLLLAGFTSCNGGRHDPDRNAQSRVEQSRDDAAPTRPEVTPPTAIAPIYDPRRLDEIARNIERDPTLGVFVATNRSILNAAHHSFSDKAAKVTIYGVAYQKVEFSASRLRVDSKYLSYEPAEGEYFFSHIERLRKTATRYPNHIAIFVHGFNQTPQAAMTAAVAVRSLLQFDGPLVLFMWPSVGAIRSYPADRLQAEVSDEALGELVCQVAKRSPGAKISILAHSMGNYLTVNALTKSAEFCAAFPKLNAVIMLSPDLPTTYLDSRASDFVARTGSATAYVSGVDVAVGASEAFWGTKNFGLVHHGMPDVIPGIRSINVSKLQLDAFDLRALGHDSYQYTQVMDDIYQLLTKGESDPTVRSLRTKRYALPGGAGDYYVMDSSLKAG